MTQEELKEKLEHIFVPSLSKPREEQFIEALALINQHVEEVIGEYEEDSRGATAPRDIRNALKAEQFRRAGLMKN